MAEREPQLRAVRFGNFEVDLRSGELRKAGVKLKLSGQPFQLLTILLECHGEVVTREELQKRLWPDTFVDADHNLNTSINKIREALGDSAESPRFVETLPRRGYRFIVPVNEIVEANDLSSAATRLGRAVSTSQLLGSFHSPAVSPFANATTTVAGQVPVAGHEAGAGQRSKPWKMVVPAAVLLAALVAGVLYHRSHRAKPLTDKDTIVLADFTNTTSDMVFDDTLKQALSIALNQSPFLSVLSEDRVATTLQLMTRPANTAITPAVARELCLRAGSKAYIAGSIANLGNEYVLGLKAVNCQNGDLLAQQQVTAAVKERVLDALSEASSELRGQLGESMAKVARGSNVPLVEATTSSLEALKAYSLGRKALREKGLDGASPYFQRAIQLDPNFSMGYWAVGNSYWHRGELRRANKYYARAFGLRAHASDREKLHIAADYYLHVTGELQKAAQMFQEEIESYPRSGAAYVGLGNMYTELGQFEKAGDAFRQYIRLTPEVGALSIPALNLALQQFDEARQVTY
jgi:DNA-binding winged helix-turn-helix (wHTH) protein/tetratricopeptide (TPR) repeat protein